MYEEVEDDDDGDDDDDDKDDGDDDDDDDDDKDDDDDECTKLHFSQFNILQSFSYVAGRKIKLHNPRFKHRKLHLSHHFKDTAKSDISDSTY